MASFNIWGLPRPPAWLFLRRTQRTVPSLRLLTSFERTVQSLPYACHPPTVHQHSHFQIEHLEKTSRSVPQSTREPLNLTVLDDRECARRVPIGQRQGRGALSNVAAILQQQDERTRSFARVWGSPVSCRMRRPEERLRRAWEIYWRRSLRAPPRSDCSTRVAPVATLWRCREYPVGVVMWCNCRVSVASSGRCRVDIDASRYPSRKRIDGHSVGEYHAVRGLRLSPAPAPGRSG